ncbi:MAG: hypothetical protein DIU54_013815 [Acidobacteriota bacterium]|nr:MAG: hypothetical protein DIU54_00020 [Acidobacteriota bacterium]
MSSAAVQSLEALLLDRRLGSTLPGLTPPPRLLPTGIEPFDRVLGGGWRMGTLSELAGRTGTGRTHLLVGTLRQAAAAGQVVALVDALDRFDPASAAGAGLDLERLLWVRGPSILAEQARPAVLDGAIRLAIRAFDLILRAGGFAVVALDLRDVPVRRLQALPAVTWLRLAQVLEGQDTVGLLLADVPLARSARGVSVVCQGEPRWAGTSAQSRRLAGFAPVWTVRSATGIVTSPAGGYGRTSAHG